MQRKAEAVQQYCLFFYFRTSRLKVDWSLMAHWSWYPNNDVQCNREVITPCNKKKGRYQPAHPHSMIEAFYSTIFSDFLSGQRRTRSDCALRAVSSGSSLPAPGIRAISLHWILIIRSKKSKKDPRKRSLQVFIYLNCFLVPKNLFRICSILELSRDTAIPTKWVVRPAKTQISLRIRAVWSDSSLSVKRVFCTLAIHTAHSKDSGQAQTDLSLRWAFMQYCRKWSAPVHNV